MRRSMVERRGIWRSVSYSEAARQVAAFADSLIGSASSRRRVMLLARIARMADRRSRDQAAGCVTVPTYTTNTSRDHQHILNNSGAAAVSVSTQKLARALMPAVLFASDCNHIISIEHISRPVAHVAHSTCGAISSGARAYRGARIRMAEVGRRDLPASSIPAALAGRRAVCAQITGCAHNVEGCIDIIAKFRWDDEIFLSFLPPPCLGHSGGQHFPVALGPRFIMPKPRKACRHIEEVRPTMMVVVPRCSKCLSRQDHEAGRKKRRRACYLMTLHRDRSASRRSQLAWWDRPMDGILSLTLRRKVGRKFGGRIKAMVSGGAPLNTDVGLFFQAMGMTVLQGYGQTEAGPVISCNRLRGGIRMDTVGPPMLNTEVRIAADGELMVRGEQVMQGYWRNEAETRVSRRGCWRPRYRPSDEAADHDYRPQKDLIIMTRATTSRRNA